MANELKRKLNEDQAERDILNGNALVGNDEVNFIQNIKRNNHNFIFPLYQRKIDLFEYEFLKTYLYALYEGTLTDGNVSVSEFAALAAISNPVVMAPRIESTNEIGLSVIENDIVYVHLEYEGSKYQITVYLQCFSRSGDPIIRHYISVLGIGPDSTKTIHLSDYLIKQSIKNSYYRNNLLSVRLDEENDIDISILKIDEFENES